MESCVTLREGVIGDGLIAVARHAVSYTGHNIRLRAFVQGRVYGNRTEGKIGKMGRFGGRMDEAIFLGAYGLTERLYG